MTPRPRNYLPCLSAWYARRFPKRPPKTDFSDELLAYADMIDVTLRAAGVLSYTYPPMPAEGYDPQPSVKSTSAGKVPE